MRGEAAAVGGDLAVVTDTQSHRLVLDHPQTDHGAHLLCRLAVVVTPIHREWCIALDNKALFAVALIVFGHDLSAALDDLDSSTFARQNGLTHVGGTEVRRLFALEVGRDDEILERPDVSQLGVLTGVQTAGQELRPLVPGLVVPEELCQDRQKRLGAPHHHARRLDERDAIVAQRALDDHRTEVVPDHLLQRVEHEAVTHLLDGLRAFRVFPEEVPIRYGVQVGVRGERQSAAIVDLDLAEADRTVLTEVADVLDANRACSERRLAAYAHLGRGFFGHEAQELHVGEVLALGFLATVGEVQDVDLATGALLVLGEFTDHTFDQRFAERVPLVDAVGGEQNARLLCGTEPVVLRDRRFRDGCRRLSVVLEQLAADDLAALVEHGSNVEATVERRCVPGVLLLVPAVDDGGRHPLRDGHLLEQVVLDDVVAGRQAHRIQPQSDLIQHVRLAVGEHVVVVPVEVRKHLARCGVGCLPVRQTAFAHDLGVARDRTGDLLEPHPPAPFPPLPTLPPLPALPRPPLTSRPLLTLPVLLRPTFCRAAGLAGSM